MTDEETIGQLAGILYELDSQGRMKIESKEKARARGVPSPDRAEALMLALCKPPQKYEYTPALPQQRAAHDSDGGPELDDFLSDFGPRRRNQWAPSRPGVSRDTSADTAALGRGATWLQDFPREKFALTYPRREDRMKWFTDLAVLGKSDALGKLIPAIESRLPPDAHRDLEAEIRFAAGHPVLGAISSDGDDLPMKSYSRWSSIRRLSASTMSSSIPANA